MTRLLPLPVFRTLPLLLLLAACAATPPPAPEAPDAAALGVRVWTDSPARSGPGSQRLQGGGAYFVRVEGNADPTRVAEVIETNWSRGADQYVLNVPPGRYALVAVMAPRDGRKVRIYLKEETIRNSIVEVKAGQLAFAGAYRIRASFALAAADETQKRYFRTIDPKYYSAGILERVAAQSDAQFERRHSVDRGADAAADFEKRTRKALEQTPWHSLMR